MTTSARTVDPVAPAAAKRLSVPMTFASCSRDEEPRVESTIRPVWTIASTSVAPTMRLSVEYV